jgi:hypothetical protein
MLRRLIPALRAVGGTDEVVESGRQAQELAYLLARAGAAVGYRYKWDLFGPFSVELAEDLRDLTPELAAEVDAPVSAETQEAANRVAIAKRPPAGMSEDRWLRLLVCVDFLITRSHVAVGNGQTPALVARNFDPEQIAAARARIEELAA